MTLTVGQMPTHTHSMQVVDVYRMTRGEEGGRGGRGKQEGRRGRREGRGEREGREGKERGRGRGRERDMVIGLQKREGGI